RHRVSTLRQLYDLKRLPLPDRPKEDLALLEYLGLIRPMMLEKLIAIRNAYEHEDAAPPDIAACRDFVDLIWYFLRSTDMWVRHVPFDFDMAARDSTGEQDEPR